MTAADELLLDTPAARPCVHKRARHEHGTRLRYALDRCRCTPCRAANTAYEANRTRQIAYGRWATYVDASPARTRVAELMATGMGLKTVASRSGLGTGTLSKLVYGIPSAGRAPSKRIRQATLDAILTVQPRIAAGVNVDAIGTRRRLQALIAAGWSMTAIAHRLNMNLGNATRLLRTQEVRESTRTAVAAVYDQLAYLPPPEAGHREKITVSRSRNRATAHGWPGPAAWFDLDVDDPAVGPDLDGVRTPLKVDLAALVEDINWILTAGGTWAEACTRLGLKPEALEARLRRAGRSDLVTALRIPADERRPTTTTPKEATADAS